MFSRTVVALLLSGLPLAAAVDADLLAAYGKLRGISLDANRVAVAENLTLKRPAGTFRFKSGVLYAFEPVLDRVAGLVFAGDGMFSFDPPAGPEQNHLARFTNGQPRLEEPFKEAVLLFSDATFEELSAGAKFKPGTVDGKARDALGELRKLFREHLKTNLEARLLAGLCSDRQSFFLAYLHGQKHGELLFALDPMNGEGVSLLHREAASDFNLWSSFSPAGYPTAEARALVHTARMEIDTGVDKGARLEGETRSEFSALQNGPRLLYLQLAHSLRVSKVSGTDGGELKYIQEAKDRDGDLWVILPKPLAQGEKHLWKISYAGDGVIRKAGTGNFFVGARDRWYPKLDVPGESFNDRALYRMKFHHPKELTLVATGNPLGKKQEGKTALSEWETEVPYTVVGFNYGDYKVKSARKSEPAVTVYANTQLGDELKELQVLLEQNPKVAASLGMLPGALNTTGIMDRTLAETANALNVFKYYFGPLPFKALSVTQQAAGNFGQSWPTLLFMPYTSFLDDTARHQLHMDEGRHRQFLDEVGAHEIAHQWWGHLVSWRDYHDQWLSEGFAQFSAGLYLHRAEGDKRFREFLEADRQFVLSRLPRGSERANDVGPIWLGHRLETDKTEGAYRLIYAKGGFVLHMLRMMMYDFARADDSRFIAMMQDFVRTYTGKGASTADFKTICDRHFGGDMSWFFDQWVYGTTVPKISIEYSITDGPQGPVFIVDSRQQNVPESFRSVIPVVLRTKTGGMSARIVLTKPALHNELKLREKPESVEFNPYYSLLCDLDVKKR